jgi:hypothetical protein
MQSNQNSNSDNVSAQPLNPTDTNTLSGWRREGARFGIVGRYRSGSSGVGFIEFRFGSNIRSFYVCYCGVWWSFAAQPVICELAHPDKPTTTSCTSAALFEQTDNSCLQHVLSIRTKDRLRATAPFPPLLTRCKCNLCCCYVLVMLSL